MSSTTTIGVHVGTRPPADWDEIERKQKDLADTAAPWFLKQRRPSFADPAIEWAGFGFEPHWVGEESAACAIAIDPSQYASKGRFEYDRFLEGAKLRGDAAIVIATVEPEESGESTSAFGDPGVSVPIISDDCTVHGKRLGSKTDLLIADGLAGADKDLALRIRDTLRYLPLWALTLNGRYHSSVHWKQMIYESPTGYLKPLIVTGLDEAVAAVWISDDGDQRVYVLPAGLSPAVLLAWADTYAISEFAPKASRAARRVTAFRADLPSLSESIAEKQLADFDSQAQAQRDELQASLDAAQSVGDRLRNGLLFETGSALVDAVKEVFESAGLTVTDLDGAFGRTASADLLVETDGRRLLVEVKSSSGNAQESQFRDLLAHLDTWPALSTTLIEGGALIINHQHKRDPADRDPQPFPRREFRESHTEPMISTPWLLEAWRAEDWPRIRKTLFGTAAAPSAQTRDTPRSRRRLPWRK